MVCIQPIEKFNRNQYHYTDAFITGAVNFALFFIVANVLQEAVTMTFFIANEICSTTFVSFKMFQKILEKRNNPNI